MVCIICETTMNFPHSVASFPGKSVHSLLTSLAGTFDAILRRPEDLPYSTAVEIVLGQLQTVANKLGLDTQEQ